MLELRHFDVQMIGGVAAALRPHRRDENRRRQTLVATLPSYLNALTGRGVHVVTVNDYLASHDAEWMGRVHSFLGLTVGVIATDLDDVERKAPPTPATSPTARITSSASTICATT